MYSRVSRGLLIVGRQFRQKLGENTSIGTGAAGCVVTAAMHRAPRNNVICRSYCNNNVDESSIAPPKLLSPNKEAEIKLKDFLAVPENERLLKIIELEIEVMRENDERVPSQLEPRDWFELVNLDSRGKRRRFLEFVWTLEKKRENLKRAKEEKQQKRADENANLSEADSCYRLGENSMFIRIYDSTMNHMWHSRLMNRMLFGQQLVLDCGYEKYMTGRELKNCAKQMQLTFATNRTHDDPFDLYFCNTNLHGDLMKHFHRFIPTVYNDDFPLNIKTESYLDLFDKKKLIYLTPHCQQEMHEFDHDAVYIIGAFVDKATNEPISLAKAKKEGLKMLKFPLDKHLHWGSSSGKNLTINQVINVLLDLRLTGSWDEALKHVPRRKLSAFRNYQSEVRMAKLFGSSKNEEENCTIQLSEPKVKETFTYKHDRSYTPKANRDYQSNTNRDYQSNTNRDYQSKTNRDYRLNSNAAPNQDFTMKSRAKFRNNWKN